MPSFYPEGNNPQSQDSQQRILNKILSATLAGSSGGGSGTLHGVGNPNGVVTGLNSQLYVDDNTQIIYVNSGGGTVWI